MEANGDRWGGWSVGERLDCSQYLILISESERETESQSVLEDVKRGIFLFVLFFFKSCSNETTFANRRAILMKFIRFSQVGGALEIRR